MVAYKIQWVSVDGKLVDSYFVDYSDAYEMSKSVQGTDPESVVIFEEKPERKDEDF